MTRGLYQVRSQAEYKLQEMIKHAREQQIIQITKWHAYFIVRDSKLIALDDYSLKTLRQFTSEDWRREHAQDWVECKELKFEYFG